MDPIVDYQEYVALIVSPPTTGPITHRWSGLVWSAKCRIKDNTNYFQGHCVFIKMECLYVQNTLKGDQIT